MTCFEIVRHTFKTKSSHNNKEAYFEMKSIHPLTTFYK